MMNKPVKISILVDNEAGAGLTAEHGFSLWIESAGISILFDTGQGKALQDNAAVLGLDFAKTDFLVLSHGHYDHSGGIPQVLAAADKAKLVLHPAALEERYSIHSIHEPRAVGMPLAARQAISRLAAERVIWSGGRINLTPNIEVTGSIPRRTVFEDSGGPFFLDPYMKEKDLLPDDQALWINLPAGLVICVGCCHAGLINTLDYVRQLSGVQKILAVIGGFHLHNANQRRIEATIEALREISASAIVACHCSGVDAVERIRAARGPEVVWNSWERSLVFS